MRLPSRLLHRRVPMYSTLWPNGPFPLSFDDTFANYAKVGGRERSRQEWAGRKDRLPLSPPPSFEEGWSLRPGEDGQFRTSSPPPPPPQGHFTKRRKCAQGRERERGRVSERTESFSLCCRFFFSRDLSSSSSSTAEYWAKTGRRRKSGFEI